MSDLKKIRVGLTHQLWALTELDDRTVFSNAIEEIALADELGYDSVWLAEHHFIGNGPGYPRLPDPEMLLARLIPETSSIFLGTGIKILSLDTPLRTVERICLLDVLSDGRAVFGVGAGNPHGFVHQEWSDEQRREAFREALTNITAALDGSMLPDGNRITPPPSADAKGKIWAGVRDPESLATAAVLGVNFIVGGADTTPVQVDQANIYRNAGGSGEVRGGRMVAVADTEEEAFALAEAPLRRTFARMAGSLPTSTPPTLLEMAETTRFFVGTPQVVAAKLNEYIAAIGAEAVNIAVNSPGMGHEEACRILRLTAEEVVPRLVFA